MFNAGPPGAWDIESSYLSIPWQTDRNLEQPYPIPALITITKATNITYEGDYPKDIDKLVQASLLLALERAGIATAPDAP